jgi:hypothetical protein
VFFAELRGFFKSARISIGVSRRAGPHLGFNRERTQYRASLSSYTAQIGNRAVVKVVEESGPFICGEETLDRACKHGTLFPAVTYLFLRCRIKVIS